MSRLTPRNTHLVDQAYAAVAQIHHTFKRPDRDVVWMTTMDVEALVGQQGCQEVWKALDRLARHKRIFRAQRGDPEYVGGGPAKWRLNPAHPLYTQIVHDQGIAEMLWSLPAMEADR